MSYASFCTGAPSPRKLRIRPSPIRERVDFPHQLRRADPGQHAFAHHRAPEGSDAGQGEEADAAEEVDWEQARAALGTDVGSDCLLAAARDMLASAVAAHDSAPDALLVPGSAAAGTACAPSIERAELVEPARLTLSGPYLFGPATVVVGEVTAPAPEPSVEVVDGVPLATLDVTLPQPVCLDPSRPVSVRLQAQDYEASAALSGSSAGCAQATVDADGTTDPEAGS